MKRTEPITQRKASVGRVRTSQEIEQDLLREDQSQSGKPGQSCPHACRAFSWLLCLVFSWEATTAEPADKLSESGQIAQRPLALIKVENPLNDTVFPPEIPPLSFRWSDRESGAKSWRLSLELPGAEKKEFAVSNSEWKPDPDAWLEIKRLTRSRSARLTIVGCPDPSRGPALSRGVVTFSTSQDEVGAPLFYREVNLPFSEAVKDPSQIRWRFGPISSPHPPRIVLDRLPVCGNCHSFSRDGQVLGMDVDYANSKGSYAITRTAKEMFLRPKDVITWDSYKREDGELTFGLLSQVSPDGKRVISTVKDKSVFVPRPDLAYSQLFFPIKGILVVYDRESGSFAPLPGADDPACVQSNPVWSPDGQHVVFARAKAYDLRNTAGRGKVLLTPQECREFTEDGKPFKFDLYRIAYNGGKGGQPEPLAGASFNDQSNYFPRYSPDGKWIVFCRAANYMLLQPDSALYIIPAAGGPARRLRANTSAMNSWHSWSPNGRWLVFSSKANGPYTQLFLTHIDAEGESSPAVLLENMTSPDRAANIPEFVNLPPDGLVRIDPHFLDDYSFERAGNEFYRTGDAAHAIEKYRRALELNPDNVNAHQRLGFLLFNIQRQFREGLAHTTEALRLDPANPFAHCDMAMALLSQRQLEQAVPHLEEALKNLPANADAQYAPKAVRFSLAEAQMQLGRFLDSSNHLQILLKSDPSDAAAHYLLAIVLSLRGEIDQVRLELGRAIALKPGIDTSALLHDTLASNLAKASRLPEAIFEAERALALARNSGKRDSAAQIESRLAAYRAAQSK